MKAPSVAGSTENLLLARRDAERDRGRQRVEVGEISAPARERDRDENRERDPASTHRKAEPPVPLNRRPWRGPGRVPDLLLVQRRIQGQRNSADYAISLIGLLDRVSEGTRRCRAPWRARCQT